MRSTTARDTRGSSATSSATRSARVLDLLLEGLSVSEVARELWLSPNTVKTHRRNIYRKLGATTREEMIERAAEAGILEPAPSDVHPGE